MGECALEWFMMKTAITVPTDRNHAQPQDTRKAAKETNLTVLDLTID
jgi:molecular chaperone DnaK (HSP70)